MPRLAARPEPRAASWQPSVPLEMLLVRNNNGQRGPAALTPPVPWSEQCIRSHLIGFFFFFFPSKGTGNASVFTF